MTIRYSLRTLARHAVLLAMVIVGLTLCLDLAYLARGSLEEFPTAEQEDKVRTVTGVLAAILLIIEAGLWLTFRRLADVDERPPSRSHP